MDATLEKSAVAHQIFSETTSLDDFIERLDRYHQVLMDSRPVNERYIFKCAPTWFMPHCGNGEYHITLEFEMLLGGPSESLTVVKQDFSFLPIFDSSRTTDGCTSVESHKMVISMDAFPKLQANKIVPMFAEATSIDHFVTMLRRYHEELMLSRPAAQRYELQGCETAFKTHTAGNSNKVRGRYQVRMQLSSPGHWDDPMELLKQDFHFMKMVGAGGGSNGNGWTAGYTVSVGLETLPKLQAQFDVLQELNAKHAQHLQDVASRANAVSAANLEMQRLEQDLVAHRVAIYRLEEAKNALTERIALDTAANTVDACAAEREALLQKFPNE